MRKANKAYAMAEQPRVHAKLTFGEQRPISDEAEQVSAFSLRMPGSLKQLLEEAAQRRGCSLNAEINRRLADSFQEQAAVGGAAVQELLRLWVAAFLRGGGLGARAQDHPEWGPDEWLADPFAYRAAVHAGQDALLAAGPSVEHRDADPEQLPEYNRLQDFFARAVARGAAVKVSRGERHE